MPARSATGVRGGDDGTPRALVAPNPSPLTLDGTRTYLVGRRRVAVVDPGPALRAHIDAVAAAAADAETVALLLTHDHPDHAGAADGLADRLGAPILAARDGGLADGDRIATDAGELVAVATPGHTPDHVAFHWPSHEAVFCGDLMMGGMETTLVAPPEGDLGDYLTSLERVRALRARALIPAHGPPFTEPDEAIDAYIRHREERERQVLGALDGLGEAGAAEIVDAVYGDGLEPGLRAAAGAAVLAYLEHLAAQDRVRRAGADRWARR